jgi:hypothetical protein
MTSTTGTTTTTREQNEPYHNSPWSDSKDDEDAYDRAQLELTRERSRDSFQRAQRAQKIKRRTQEWKDVLRNGREQADIKMETTTTNSRNRRMQITADNGDNGNDTPTKATATKTARELKAERLRARAEVMHNAKKEALVSSRHGHGHGHGQSIKKRQPQVVEDEEDVATIETLREKRERRRLEEARVRKQKRDESNMDKAQLLELEMASPAVVPRNSTIKKKVAPIRPKPTPPEETGIGKRGPSAQHPPIVTPPKQNQQQRHHQQQQHQQQLHHFLPRDNNWKVTDKGGSMEWMENLFENMCCTPDEEETEDDDDTYDAYTHDDSAVYTDYNKHYKEIAVKRKPSYNDYAVFYQ